MDKGDEMDIGEAVKRERLARNLSIRDLANSSGLSPSAISKIENNKTIPNVITMKQLANAMGMSAARFFIEKEDELVELIKKEDRPIFKRNENPLGIVTEEIMARGPNNQMQPCIISFPGGANSEKAVTHQGEEFTFVLKGSILCVLEGYETYELEEGDTLYFPSHIPHRWENLSATEEAKILVVATPQSF